MGERRTQRPQTAGRDSGPWLRRRLLAVEAGSNPMAGGRQKFLEFAAYYGFVPRVCRPYRPETKGKIESTVRFVKQNFWPGIDFDSLQDLNQQARAWMEKINHQTHSTTREVPYQRLPQERLLLLDEQPDYDTSYMEDRRVAKDCMLSYRGNP